VTGPSGTVGKCVDVGFFVQSFMFIQDNEDYTWTEAIAGWPSNETCVASADGLRNAPIQGTSANENFVTCSNLEVNTDPDQGFTQFLVGQY
jgi:hypothetical protein